MKAVGDTSSREVIVKGVNVVGLRVLGFDENSEEDRKMGRDRVGRVKRARRRNRRVRVFLLLWGGW
jgi:hypothetical protein